jgi:hypothetical protein
MCASTGAIRFSPDGGTSSISRNGRWKSSTARIVNHISRVPRLKAVVLLGKGRLCWGGGLFASIKTWLNGLSS